MRKQLGALMVAAVMLFIACAPFIPFSPKPSPTVVSTTPVRVIIAGFSDYPVPAGAQDVVCNKWVPQIQFWFYNQAKVTFPDITCEAHTSAHPISYFGPQDACGEGVSFWPFWNLYVQNELGIGVGNDISRSIIIQVHGGGDAAGPYAYSVGPPETNFGTAIVGDWTLTYALTGQPDSCCLSENIYGTAPCYRADDGATGHETLNAFSCGIFFDNTLNTGDTMQDVHKQALHDPCNARWLR